MADFITQIDFSILDFIQNNLRCDILDKIMVFLSLIGEGGVVWFLIAVSMLFFKKSTIKILVSYYMNIDKLILKARQKTQNSQHNIEGKEQNEGTETTKLQHLL